MEVHIFKGSMAKSVILEQFFIGKEGIACFAYYDPSRPYPTHINNIIMADRSVISIGTMIAGIRLLADSGIENFVIYTNCTKEENNEFIKTLENIKDKRGVVIVMCQK